MYDWHLYHEAIEHNKDLRRQAEHQRLVRQVRDQKPLMETIWSRLRRPSKRRPEVTTHSE